MVIKILKACETVLLVMFFKAIPEIYEVNLSENNRTYLKPFLLLGK